jgi:hypothetical protein
MAHWQTPLALQFSVWHCAFLVHLPPNATDASVMHLPSGFP